MLDMNNSHWRGTSTEQIRQGLERIKQAQEDVLNQLRKQQPTKTTSPTNRVHQLQKELQQVNEKWLQTEKLHLASLHQVKTLESQNNHLNQQLRVQKSEAQRWKHNYQQIQQQHKENQLRIQTLTLNNQQLQCTSQQLQHTNKKLATNVGKGQNEGRLVLKEVIREIGRMNSVHEYWVEKVQRKFELSTEQIRKEQEYQNSMAMLLANLQNSPPTSQSFNHQHLQVENEHLKTQLKTERSEKQKVLSEIHHMKQMLQEVQINNKNTHQHEYNKIIEQLQGQMKQILQEKQSMKKSLLRVQQSEKTAKALKREMERVRAEYESAVVERQQLKLQVHQLQQTLDKVQNQLEESINQCSQIRQLYKQSQQKVHTIETNIQQHNLQLQSATNKCKLLQQQLEQRRNQQQELQQQNQQLLQQTLQIPLLQHNQVSLQQENKTAWKLVRHNQQQLNHLWSIKEVQYSNINHILSHFH